MLHEPSCEPTSISCRRWTRTYIVLYGVWLRSGRWMGKAGVVYRSNVDRRKYRQRSSADDGRQFVTLSVHVCRTRLTRRCDDRRAVTKLSKSRVWRKVPVWSIAICRDIQILLQCSPKKPPCQKISSIRLTFSVQHRLVEADRCRDTDKGRQQ